MDIEEARSSLQGYSFLSPSPAILHFPEFPPRASIPSKMSSSDVIGIVVIARHGDRQGFYQDPTSYTASATSITPLGEVSVP